MQVAGSYGAGFDVAKSMISDSSWLGRQYSFTDVFVPQSGVLLYELLHQRVALLVVEVDHFYPMGDHALFDTGERPRFACHHLLDAELDDGSGAEVTWHEGRLEGRIFVAANASGVLETIDFGMGYRVSMLYASVVSAPDDFLPLISTEPMGMPPSTSPFRASSIAAFRKGSISHLSYRAR